MGNMKSVGVIKSLCRGAVELCGLMNEDTNLTISVKNTLNQYLYRGKAAK